MYNQGFSTERNCFTQSFGADALDASLLLIPLVGFLPHEDTRVKDLGLLSEEYDPQARRMTGNMPQAFSRTALIASAVNLSNGGRAITHQS